jgi:hypothetical protein
MLYTYEAFWGCHIGLMKLIKMSFTEKITLDHTNVPEITSVVLQFLITK